MNVARSNEQENKFLKERKKYDEWLGMWMKERARPFVSSTSDQNYDWYKLVALFLIFISSVLLSTAHNLKLGPNNLII